MFGVNEEEAEILQVETKDRKSTEWICVAQLKISKKYCFLTVNLQIQGEGEKKKKVSFQQEMKVKTTDINSLTFEMGKNKHIVIDVQRDRVNRQQQFPTPLVRNRTSLKGHHICMYLCLHWFYKTTLQLNYNGKTMNSSGLANNLLNLFSSHLLI